MTSFTKHKMESCSRTMWMSPVSNNVSTPMTCPIPTYSFGPAAKRESVTFSSGSSPIPSSISPRPCGPTSVAVNSCWPCWNTRDVSGDSVASSVPFRHSGRSQTSPCRNTKPPANNRLNPYPRTASRFDPRRIYTILVLAPLVYAVIRYLPPLAFSGVVVLAGGSPSSSSTALCFGGRSHSWLIGIGLTGFAALILGTYRPDILVPTLLATLVGIISVPLLSRAPLEQSLRDGAMTLFGVLYLGLTLSTLSMTRLLPQGEWLIFFLLLVTWASDTGAYYVGTLYGRHRLAPTISPKKTVEGLVGGLIGAIIVAYAARWWFLPELSSLDCLILAILLTITGLWGDLTESAMKRSVGMKDSGGILPGHGGMLDRLDSLLFTAPVFYYYVTMVSRLRVIE